MKLKGLFRVATYNRVGSYTFTAPANDFGSKVLLYQLLFVGHTLSGYIILIFSYNFE